MHLTARRQKITGTGGKDKIAAVGILERGGRIRMQVVDRKRQTLQALVRDSVEPGSNIYTDARSVRTSGSTATTPPPLSHARE